MYYERFDNTFWIVAGIGLVNKDKKLRIADRDDWEKCIMEEHFPDYGHYSILILNGNKLRLINDPSGIRTIYYCHKKNIIFFSTRISDLAEITEKKSPDIGNIGSFYMLSTNFNNGTEIKEIQKLMYDEELIIDNNRFHLKKCNEIKKHIIRYKKAAFNNIFTNFLKSISNNNILLALSGGFDSRYIMSVMLKNNIHFKTFTFGCKNELDSLMAIEISNACNIEHQLFDNYDKLNLIDKIKHYLSYNPFSLSTHRVPYLYNYKTINFKNRLIIDGGFGEFHSKRFFVKWRLLSRFGINNPELIYKLISKSVPAIFNKDIQIFSEKKTIESFKNSLEEFRNDPYLDHPIDYIFLKYIYGNHWSREQSFMDEYISSCIPFIQAPIIAVSEKNRLHTYSKHIKTNANILSKYPFIKKNSKLPFPEIERFIRKALRPIRSNSYNTKDICDFYNITEIKEYIYDSIDSSEFRNSSLLDQEYIIDCVNQFYKEENTYTISIIQTFISFIATKHITH